MSILINDFHKAVLSAINVLGPSQACATTILDYMRPKSPGQEIEMPKLNASLTHLVNLKAIRKFKPDNKKYNYYEIINGGKRILNPPPQQELVLAGLIPVKA